jgi:hypothetical protein
MRTSTKVFLVVIAAIVAAAVLLHLSGANASGVMDGLKKMHGRG